GWAEVREDEPTELVDRIGALPHALAEPAPRRVPRLLEPAAVDVEDPAVIAAAEAALERDGELERRAAMRAVEMEHADARAAVAEDHQILAEDAHAPRRPVEVARERDRLPSSRPEFPVR